MLYFPQIIPNTSGQIETDASTADGRVALYTTYLKLTNVDQSNEGEYQCGFKNDFGRDYSDNAKLQVLGKFTDLCSEKRTELESGSV